MKALRYKVLNIIAGILLIGIAAWIARQVWGRVVDATSPESADIESSAILSNENTLTQEDGKSNEANSTSQSLTKPGVDALYDFASKVELYQFNPDIDHYIAETSRIVSVIIATKSHVAQIRNGELISVSSHSKGSDTRHDPNAIRDWYKCKARWTEEEAIQKTLEILDRLNLHETRQSVENGKKKYLATEIEVLDNAGNKVSVTPFPKVMLYDTNGTLRVEAEYRMGEHGPVGLTQWFRL